MAGIAYLRAVRQAIRTTTGTQDFTVSGVGTPKGAIVMLSRASADGVTSDNISYVVGFTDGTNSQCNGWSSLDNAADSDTARAWNSNLIRMIDPVTNTSIAVAANFSAWVTDGVQLNFTVVDGTAWLCTVILICGADAQVFVGSFDMADNTGVPNQTLDVTSPGFIPSWIMGIQTGITAASASPSSSLVSSIGFASNSLTVKQSVLSFSHGDAKATSTPSLRIATDAFAVTIRDAANAGGVSVSSSIQLDSFITNGFRVKDTIGGDPAPVQYIAVGMSTLKADIATIDSPTSTGAVTMSMTDPGSALIIGTLSDATGTAKADSAGGVFSLGFASQSEEFSIGVYEQDAQATMNNGSFTDDKAISVLTDSGGTGLVASGSFSTTNLSLNFTTVQGTARKQFVMLFPRAIFAGTAAISGFHPLIAATGKLVFRGTAAVTGFHPLIAATSKEVFRGTAAISGFHPLIAASSKEVFRGTAAISGFHLLIAATSKEVFRGTSDIVGSHLLIAATSKLVFRGTAAISGFHPLIAASSSLVFRGTASLTGPHALLDATASLIFRGTGSLIGPSALISGIGLTDFTAVGTLIGPSPQMAAIGRLVFRSSGDLIGPSIEIQGTSSNQVIASGDLLGPHLSVSSLGLEIFRSSGSPVGPHFSVASSSLLVFRGTADLVGPHILINGSNIEDFSCTSLLSGSYSTIDELDGAYGLVAEMLGSYDMVVELRGSIC